MVRINANANDLHKKGLTMKRIRYLYLLVLLAVFTITFIFAQGPLPAPQGIVVYTSIYPLYDFTKRIAGPYAHVVNITPPGAEPHSFEPSPRLITQLLEADLFLYNGLGMEPYINKIKQSLQGGSLSMIDASSDILPLLSSAHGHIAVDPHAWLSPFNAAKQAHAIFQALSEVDPVHRAEYNANYKALHLELIKLDDEFKNTLDKCPKKSFVVTHAAFGYLARDYGLEQIALTGLEGEAEPTPGTFAEVIALIERQGIRHVFVETSASAKIAETLAREIQAGTLTLHPLASLTARELQDKEDYFSLMRKNLENLKTALEYTS